MYEGIGACWEWTKATDKQGYGVRTVDGKQIRVHRQAYQEATGEDPGDLLVLHRCDNPVCYRPAHLYLGTHQDNMDDKVARGRCRNQYTDVEACIYGHAFTPENTYVNPSSGSRQCRECRRKFNALDKKLGKYPEQTRKLLKEVFRERLRQDFEFGIQDHPDGTGRPGDLIMAESAKILNDHKSQVGTLTFRDILEEEVREAYVETDLERLREELVQVAAVALAWAESIDRRTT